MDGLGATTGLLWIQERAVPRDKLPSGSRSLIRLNDTLQKLADRYSETLPKFDQKEFAAELRLMRNRARWVRSRRNGDIDQFCHSQRHIRNLSGRSLSAS
jgi:hypothetical protein